MTKTKILLPQNGVCLKMTNFRSKISISKKSTEIHSRPEILDFVKLSLYSAVKY